MTFFDGVKTLAELNERRSKILLELNGEFQLKKQEIASTLPDYKVVRVHNVSELNIPNPDVAYPVFAQRQEKVNSPVLTFDLHGAVNY